MVAEFERRRDWIVPALNDIEGMKCQMPKGAFYVFPNIGGICESLGIVEAYGAMTPEVQARTSPSGMFQMFLLYRYESRPWIATRSARSERKATTTCGFPSPPAWTIAKKG